MPRKVMTHDRMEQPRQRRYAIIGKHSKRCVDEQHPDYAHALTADLGCRFGTEKKKCDCTAHYAEDFSSRLGQ